MTIRQAAGFDPMHGAIKLGQAEQVQSVDDKLKQLTEQVSLLMKAVADLQQKVDCSESDALVASGSPVFHGSAIYSRSVFDYGCGVKLVTYSGGELKETPMDHVKVFAHDEAPAGMKTVKINWF